MSREHCARVAAPEPLHLPHHTTRDLQGALHSTCLGSHSSAGVAGAASGHLRDSDRLCQCDSDG